MGGALHFFILHLAYNKFMCSRPRHFLSVSYAPVYIYIYIKEVRRQIIFAIRCVRQHFIFVKNSLNQLCLLAEKHIYKNFQKALYARMMSNNIVSQIIVHSFFP